ncbi:hypothetical protein H634G_03683 [Metarhizium anisopliae BRIP 53293]|uniref:Uncharacterized protein n=1 Tax=Metarhizium anisopliae BRIP 53293 TaxID=1291518 RepID=A0A0D9P4K8_METAN|nr:hypothetical protein H634G_03683 [Metarhizium anisopliae BRIP 53293]KJK92109.1 hypothetical protein H633G_04054 [Metarhizium anisopliae BRIP 53284]
MFVTVEQTLHQPLSVPVATRLNRASQCQLNGHSDRGWLVAATPLVAQARAAAEPHMWLIVPPCY